jgi:hypothetical protein
MAGQKYRISRTGKILFYCLLFSLLLTSHGFSQKTFIYSEKDSLNDETFLDGTELSSGNLLLVGSKVHFGNDSTAAADSIVVTKLSPDGKLIARSIFHSGLVNCIIQMDPNLILLSGIVSIDDSARILLISIDTSLNLLSRKVIPIPGYNVFYSCAKIDENRNILIYGNAAEPTIYKLRHAFIYRLSPELDSLGFVLINTPSELDVDLLIKPENTGYYLFMVLQNSGPFFSNGQIVNLDENFNIVRIDSIPMGVYNRNNSRWISDKNFLLTGYLTLGYPTHYQHIGAVVLDTNNTLYSYANIGPVDTSEIPSWPKNLDFQFISDVYIGGIYSYNGWSEWGSQNSWFALNHVDTALNLDWQKYYGGDKNYELNGLLATKDSGCLMYGSTYDWQNNAYGRNLYAIKVNKEGKLLNSVNPLQDIAKEVIIFPNPGIDKLYIRTSLISATISLYDMIGNCILTKNIRSGTDQLFVGSLSPGIYIYHVLKEGQIIESGKWIKE